MNKHVKEFFKKSPDQATADNFHHVIALEEEQNLEWGTLNKLVPDLCKGWYELSHLTVKDRIEFTRDFWFNKLPYHCGFSQFLLKFFDSMDDINVFITQKNCNDPFEATIVYSIKDNSGFYRGGSPAQEEEIEALQQQFSNYILPVDYKAFLRIHNGFRKTTDCTGLTRINHMKEKNEAFQQLLSTQDQVLTIGGKEVNPKSLIAFYESFGMPFFQCFWGDWYPAEEMGNVYYSATTKRITHCEGAGLSPENLAFPTFLDWLKFYLEQISD